MTLGSCAAYRLGGLRYTVLSAILRCLVSNFSSMKNLRRCWGSFHPLYRGTWFPTGWPLLGRCIFRWRSHPLYRGTWFPTALRRYLEREPYNGFHPLYRGTWFPTGSLDITTDFNGVVSIRYIAVLGFQHWGEDEWREVAALFPSAISRYLVSNPHLAAECAGYIPVFPSAISRYLVSNGEGQAVVIGICRMFPSAISRYLVSNTV